ncbi:hypothetical protein NDU88_002785 [Pleurodeles waltl]|uniref:Uncharacterized protein n=1 Tax=Pleurodeles waltl TaxID=8319 RepID=A0AAV7VFK5_PLEWA|nr:hypothetical protein NDU88_002785 [Pleurodeles waltl]
MPVGPPRRFISSALSCGIAPVIRGGESFPPLSLRPLLISSASWRPRSGMGVAAEPAPSLRVGHLALPLAFANAFYNSFVNHYYK